MQTAFHAKTKNKVSTLPTAVIQKYLFIKFFLILAPAWRYDRLKDLYGVV